MSHREPTFNDSDTTATTFGLKNQNQIPFPTTDSPTVGPTNSRRQNNNHSNQTTSPPTWRGLLLDCSRTFFSVETIERLLTVMGRYGFNRLHWHLTDNSGWRLHIPSYPRLATIASQLPRLPFDDYTEVATPEVIRRAQQLAPERWQNGIYTAEDVRRVLNTATKYGIDIMPEIDLPGHMAAAIIAYPELGNPEAETKGLRNDLLWPSHQSQQFITTVLDTVCDLFPSPYVHIGGDECNFSLWETDPALNKWMHQHGITEHRNIQTWFMRLAATHLKQRGKTVVAWDEVGEIDPTGDYLIIGWDGARGMERLAQCQQPYVFADLRWLYLNYADRDGSADQLGFFPPISVEEILNAPWPQTHDPRCQGIQACLWTEFVLDETIMWQLLLPRLLAVAERIWDPLGENRATARQRIGAEYEWLKEQLKL